ncbi:unnamed protein product [Periconia digitata]|uniref:Pre-mRNA polyadenylation factor Fip1 domain-containing protein n=1 Tax=Periconia digitata TaxID=1303443 RepID=A0A9W4US74_9PLEO|nr:unnamed protein product [Periconia digitata]
MNLRLTLPAFVCCFCRALPTVRFGLKRGKLVYVFNFSAHDVQRDKHRNVISRARFIKAQLELAGYHLIPWDFKKDQPPRFWLHQHPEPQQPHSSILAADMEEEDDDLYGPSETTVPGPAPAAELPSQPTPGETSAQELNHGDASEGDEPMDEGLESGEDSDDSDDSDDLEIIIDRPSDKPNLSQQQQQHSTPSESKAIKIEAPPGSQQQQLHQPGTSPSLIAGASGIKPAPPSHHGQPGTAFPAVQSSTITMDANPSYPPLGKPILTVDMDADLAEHTKPWRLPGVDQSDYFNYGFDEFTWEMYRQRQSTMSNTLTQQKAETAQLQSFFDPRMMSGGGSGSNPGGTGANPPTGPSSASGGGNGVPPNAPTGPSGGGASAAGAGGGMPGMPSEEMMQQMMQQMMSQGVDPSNMDFNTFAQMMGGGFPGSEQQQYPQGPAGRGASAGVGSARRGGRGRGW